MTTAKEKRKQQHILNGDKRVPFVTSANNPLNPSIKKTKGSFSTVPIKSIVSKNSAMYYEDRNVQIFKLAILGLKMSEMANVIGVGTSTLKKWLKKYPAFKESYDAGRIEASAEVAISLYKLATGYSHPEQKIFMNKIKEFDPDTGKLIREYNEPLIVDSVKHYAPNFNAINKFLAIKEPDKWREDNKAEVEHSFALQKGSEEMGKISTEELALMESIGLKKKSKKKK